MILHALATHVCTHACLIDAHTHTWVQQRPIWLWCLHLKRFAGLSSAARRLLHHFSSPHFVGRSLCCIASLRCISFWVLPLPNPEFRVLGIHSQILSFGYQQCIIDHIHVHMWWCIYVFHFLSGQRWNVVQTLWYSFSLIALLLLITQWQSDWRFQVGASIKQSETPERTINTTIIHEKK